MELTALLNEKERKKNRCDETVDEAQKRKREKEEEDETYFGNSRKNVLFKKMKFLLSLCEQREKEKEIEYDSDEESDLVLSIINCR